MKSEWTRAATDDLLKNILGPLARTWKDKNTGRVSLGVQKGDQKLVLGSGDSYRSCFERVFVNTVGAMEKLDAEFGQEWRSQITQLKEQINKS